MRTTTLLVLASLALATSTVSADAVAPARHETVAGVYPDISFGARGAVLDLSYPLYDGSSELTLYMERFDVVLDAAFWAFAADLWRITNSFDTRQFDVTLERTDDGLWHVAKVERK